MCSSMGCKRFTVCHEEHMPPGWKNTVLGSGCLIVQLHSIHSKRFGNRWTHAEVYMRRPVHSHDFIDGMNTSSR
jgi:hypothetical protein